MESSPTAALQKKQLKYITAAVEREIDSMEMKRAPGPKEKRREKRNMNQERTGFIISLLSLFFFYLLGPSTRVFLLYCSLLGLMPKK